MPTWLEYDVRLVLTYPIAYTACNYNEGDAFYDDGNGPVWYDLTRTLSY